MINNGDKILLVDAADGTAATRCFPAGPVTFENHEGEEITVQRVLSGEKIAIVKTADGIEIPIRVVPVTKAGQRGIAIETADGHEILVSPWNSYEYEPCSWEAGDEYSYEYEPCEGWEAGDEYSYEYEPCEGWAKILDIDDTEAQFIDGTLTQVEATNNNALELAYDPASSTILIDDQFNDLGDWDVTNHCVISTDEYISSPSSVLVGDESGTNDGIKQTFTPQTTQFIVTYYGRYTNVGDRYNLLYVSKNGQGPSINLAFNEDKGGLCYFYGSSYTSIKSTSTNTWYEIKIDIDVPNNNYDVYVDGVLESANIPFRFNAAQLDICEFINNYKYPNPAYYDDVFVGTRAYYTTGNRVTQHDISAVSTVSDSLIKWDETLNGQTITVQTRYSLNGGTTWSSWATATNDDVIPGLTAGTDVSNGLLEVKETLSTTNTNVTPKLTKREIYIYG